MEDQVGILWTAFLGAVSIGLSLVVGIIGWFLKGAISKADDTARELATFKGEVDRRVAVLEERVSAVTKLEATLSSMRSELLSQLTSFREELRTEMGELRHDVRAATSSRPSPRT